ncbi:MMPL family transporter [Streptomyces sp. NPDC046557]|uniref:MMPL family transporter n=1 Tax=Streptomyces sp. NPDC046557 TaxID=3155372 RepID=UPI0034009C02
MANLTVRRPIAVILCWIAILLIGITIGSGVLNRMNGGGSSAPGSESNRGGKAIDELYRPDDVITAVIAGESVDSPTLRSQVASAVTDIKAINGVGSVVDPYQVPQAVAPDGRALTIHVGFPYGMDGDAADKAIQQSVDRLKAIDAPQVLVSGGPLVNQEMNAAGNNDVTNAELYSLPVVVLLLGLVFAGVTAAFLPLAVAFCGISGSLLVLYGLSFVTDINSNALQVTTMLGLGLAIDYALLMVSRFREERAKGGELDDAVRRTVLRGGRTVAFSALTVAVCLAGLTVFNNPALRSIGLATAAVVFIDMAAALTLLPALLTRFGHRVSAKPANPRAGSAFGRIARVATARPVITALATTAVLAFLAAPALGMKSSSGDARSLPKSSESRQFFEIVAAHFPVGTQADPVLVLVQGHGPEYDTFTERIRHDSAVLSSSVSPSPSGGSLVKLTPAGTSDGSTALALVERIRADRGDLDFLVSGPAARVVDYQAMLMSGLPWATLIVVGGLLALLFAFTGSLLISVKTILTTALSLGASLGVVTWVFQDGHGAGMFGSEGLGALNLVAPPLIVGVAFGLAMDYEIFILARVREAWLAGEDSREAVVTGLQRSGRIVSCAALLILIVFGAFMLGGYSPVLQIGLGLSLAVLFDATIVRMLLVPATMALLGRTAWWAPAPLRRLHDRFGLKEADDELAEVVPLRAGAIERV